MPGQENSEGEWDDWNMQSYFFQSICESRPHMNAISACKMPHLLPSERASVAAVAKQVWRDHFLTAHPQFTGDTSKENHHITQCNVKSKEFYGHMDLGSVSGFESLCSPVVLKNGGFSRKILILKLH